MAAQGKGTASQTGAQGPSGAGTASLSSGGGTIGLGPGQTLPTEGHPLSVCSSVKMGTLMSGCKEGGLGRVDSGDVQEPHDPSTWGPTKRGRGGWQLSGGSSGASSHQGSHLLPQLLK